MNSKACWLFSHFALRSNLIGSQSKNRKIYSHPSLVIFPTETSIQPKTRLQQSDNSLTDVALPRNKHLKVGHDKSSCESWSIKKMVGKSSKNTRSEMRVNYKGSARVVNPVISRGNEMRVMESIKNSSKGYKTITRYKYWKLTFSLLAKGYKTINIYKYWKTKLRC